ncbi:hypothetical protein F4604DRAFT_1884250 [Suillus subluteus]|nr:hypothetical protein F4604DRAFT_1884250 [Suillus subluteus]
MIQSSSYDKQVLRAFAYESFNMLPSAFPAIQLPSLKQTRARVAFLAGLSPAQYDCCINSCCCFIGPLKDLDIHSHQLGMITDVFNGSLYQELLAKKVSINGHELAHNHFSELRDIALSLATDGFAPFRR